MSMLAIDVSGLAPEARPIVEAAARVYLGYVRPWFLGLIAHGSAVKGGFIPGCSDIDLQLYLEDAAFTAEGQLPLDLALAIHEELAKIDLSPFAYIQCYPLPCRLREGWAGPIPGTYHIVAGRLPVAEATAEDLAASARRDLSGPTLYSFSANNLLKRGLWHPQRDINLLRTQVWPALYDMLALQEGDPIRIWGLRKEQAIALLPEESPIGRSYRRFHEALLVHYPAESSVEGALRIIQRGMLALRHVKEWWEAFSSQQKP